jgi:hypothetical protein
MKLQEMPLLVALIAASFVAPATLAGDRVKDADFHINKPPAPQPAPAPAAAPAPQPAPAPAAAPAPQPAPASVEERIASADAALVSLWPLWYVYAYPEFEPHAWHLSRDEQVKWAISHWNGYGAIEGRSPNPFFNPRYYADKSPDLFGTDIKDFRPVVRHFIVSGIDKGCQGSPLFDPKYYMATYPDVANAYGAENWRWAWRHFVMHGAAAGRQPAHAIDPNSADLVCLHASLLYAGGWGFAYWAGLALTPHIGAIIATGLTVIIICEIHRESTFVSAAHAAGTGGHAGDTGVGDNFGGHGGGDDEEPVMIFTDGSIITPSPKGEIRGGGELLIP